jgi:hypothetical protein
MQGLMALIARADIVISIDTGPMHLAVAMNRPTIGLMPLHRHKFDWTPQGAANFVAVRKPAIDEITSEEILGAEVLLRSKFPHKASSAIKRKKLNSPIVLSSMLKRAPGDEVNESQMNEIIEDFGKRLRKSEVWLI